MTETSEMHQELQKANRAADVRTRLRVEQARREVAREIFEELEDEGLIEQADMLIFASELWGEIKAKYLEEGK